MGPLKEGAISATVLPFGKRPLAADAVLQIVQHSLDDDKSEDVVVIDLQGKTSIGDFMVVASGRSHRHVNAITQHLATALKDNGVRGARVEGADKCDWVLIDAGDVIVHIFRPEIRSFYNLEKMWQMPGPQEAAG